MLILGAGVIGLSLALELRARGHAVTVLHRPSSPGEASPAAAGMLAVEDPHNPPELLPLARLSRELYPAFLASIEALSGMPVPFQTEVTVQTMPDGSVRRLAENSLDPRQLLSALLEAVNRAGARFLPAAGDPATNPASQAPILVHAAGAWPALKLSITPRKGQMLRVRLPPDLPLAEVYRSEDIYIVPRTRGPQAGTALIGATVEDVGFDVTTHPGALGVLRHLAAGLFPAFADSAQTPTVEGWAGLRPASPDELPLIGELPANAGLRTQRHFVATGHFRNGILLAPVTAVLLADLIEGRAPRLSLQPFSPTRFAAH